MSRLLSLPYADEQVLMNEALPWLSILWDIRCPTVSVQQLQIATVIKVGVVDS